MNFINSDIGIKNIFYEISFVISLFFTFICQVEIVRNEYYLCCFLKTFRCLVEKIIIKWMNFINSDIGIKNIFYKISFVILFFFFK